MIRVDDNRGGFVYTAITVPWGTTVQRFPGHPWLPAQRRRPRCTAFSRAIFFSMSGIRNRGRVANRRHRNIIITPFLFCARAIPAFLPGSYHAMVIKIRNDITTQTHAHATQLISGSVDRAGKSGKKKPKQQQTQYIRNSAASLWSAVFNYFPIVTQARRTGRPFCFFSTCQNLRKQRTEFIWSIRSTGRFTFSVGKHNNNNIIF